VSSSTTRPSQTSSTSSRTSTSTVTSTSSQRTTTSTITSTSQRTTTTASTSAKCTLVCIVNIPSNAGSNKTSIGYSPATIVVVVGINNTLMWVNHDSAYHTVTATSPLNAFNSGDLAPNQTYSLILTAPGTYSYHCLYDSWMHGTIIVKSM
jgi:plastocyanin